MTLHADLTGKIAFVTGASSGLGRHFACLLARSGAQVVVGARRFEAVEALAQEIAGQGGRAFPVPLDVSEPSSVQQAVAAAVSELGTIDILVNNAGVTSSGEILELSAQQWDTVLDTNLRGAFLVATEVARHMRAAAKGGSLINIASILGLRQAGRVAPYAVSKAGLLQLTAVMALELARYGIRANALAPGYIDTDMNREFWRSESGAAAIKRIPQRRLGKLEDLDGSLLLLASDASSFMTGAVITVDGGHLMSTL